jgi:hypothetical protein
MIRASSFSCLQLGPYDTHTTFSGIGGGVVAQNLFLSTFGMIHSDGTINTSKRDSISSNVVSVLQAGAFFGALGSAPITGGVFKQISSSF